MGNRGNGFDMMRPFNNNQPLIYWLLDDPAVAERYRSILKELSATAFSKAEVDRLIDALEKDSPAKIGAPRSFLEGRAATVKQLVDSWAK